MVEEDYILKLVQELVRSLLKMVFGIDSDAPTSELLEKEEDREHFNRLVQIVEQGNITDAEAEVIEATEDLSNEGLLLSLIFFHYLNEKSDRFLEDNGYDRVDLKESLRDIVTKYGYESMAMMFLQ